jgi:hypothetical protein
MRDSSFEVAAHSHGKRWQPKLPGLLPQGPKVRRWIVLGRRDAHQSFDRQAVHVFAPPDKTRRLGWRDPRLLRLRPRIDLHEQL